MAVPGVDLLKKFVLNQGLNNTVRTYFVLAALAGAKQQYDARCTFNYWFGKIEMERRLSRSQL